VFCIGKSPLLGRSDVTPAIATEGLLFLVQRPYAMSVNATS
jgi:hypothetical protein